MSVLALRLSSLLLSLQRLWPTSGITLSFHALFQMRYTPILVGNLQ
jgi:hypothetical protein